MRYKRSYSQMQERKLERISKNFFNSEYVKLLKLFNLETQEYEGGIVSNRVS